MDFFGDKRLEPPTNQNEKQKSDAAFGSELATVAPPPSEVHIRTMESDLRGITQSGGAPLPQFENVAVTKTTLDTPPSPLLKNIAFMVAIVAVLAVIGGGIYFLFTTYGERLNINVPAEPTPTPVAPPPSPQPISPQPSGPGQPPVIPL